MIRTNLLRCFARERAIRLYSAIDCAGEKKERKEEEQLATGSPGKKGQVTTSWSEQLFCTVALQ